MFKQLAPLCALVLLSLGLAFGFAGPVHAAKHKAAPVVEAAVEKTAAPEHAADAGHGEESGGMPQMDVSRFPGQLFWLAITFILTYLLMKHVALPGVEKTLETREKRISADIGGSKAKNEAAKHLMTEYEARLSKARSDAQNATRVVTDESAKKAAAALDEQTTKVNADIKAADARILTEKNKAIAALDKEVVSVVGALVKSVAGITPSPSEIETALQKVRNA